MEVLSSSCLIILLVVSYLASVFFRALFSKFIKLEAVPILQKWGGLLLGGARGILAASLVAIILSS